MASEDINRWSTKELVQRLMNNFSALLDTEVRLAKSEMSETVTATKQAAILLGVAAVLGLVGVTWLFGVVVMLLATIWSGWLAALVVAVVLLVIAAIVGLIGKGKIQTRPLERTRQTLKEDLEWTRHRLI